MSAQKIVDIAKKEIGYKEGPNNDTKYGKSFGLNNQPWCAEFVWWVAKVAGEDSKILKTASCIELEKWAKKNDLIVPISLVQAGDILLFDFSKKGVSEHTGYAIGYNKNTHLIDTVEGNTSSGKGSQVNGDGVYERERALSAVRFVIRPKWSNK